jgi:hypothetical protein
MAVAALAGVTGVLWKPLSDRVVHVEDALEAHIFKDDHPIAHTQRIEHLEKQVDTMLERVTELEARDAIDKDINARFRFIEDIVWSRLLEQGNVVSPRPWEIPQQ